MRSWFVIGFVSAGLALVQPPSEASIQQAIQQTVANCSVLPSGIPCADPSTLRALYAPRGFAPMWIAADWLPTRDAADAIDVLRSASDEGLEPQDYDVVELSAIAKRLQTSGCADAIDAAVFDVGLSAATLAYLHDLHAGRVDPRALGIRLNAAADPRDYPGLLRAAAEAHQVPKLASELRPRFRQYAALQQMLLRYRELAREPNPELPTLATRRVRPGEKHSGVAALYRELVNVGDVAPGSAPSAGGDRYEQDLVDGVRHFQARHGLTADGTIGPETLAALRVPLDRRVRQIELSMERFRWLPDPPGGRVILINIPMFRLWAWSSAQAPRPDLTMAVIVGRALRTETPVLREQMTQVIFRPYWNVPSSILGREVLPHVQRDPDYLRRESMEIVQGDGSSARVVGLSAEAIEALRKGTARVRQRPGAGNALGLVKFVFPNEEDVYLHGTPAQALFSRARRDFSHGCVRVEDPVALAAWVLNESAAWTPDRIVAAMNATQSGTVNLLHPVQVVLFYSTAAVMPDDGTIWFADDVYRADARLERALQAPKRCTR